jgi:hypothetical protein
MSASSTNAYSKPAGASSTNAYSKPAGASSTNASSTNEWGGAVMRYATPDGEWRIELITLDATPQPGGREPGRESGGDGESWRVLHRGYYHGSARTPEEIETMIGSVAFAGLTVEAPRRGRLPSS